MKTETIRTLSTNALFIIGVILLIVGFVRGSSTVAKLFIFEKYPLQSYEETRCSLEVRPVTAPDVVNGEKVATESNQELKERQENCQTTVEHQRQVKQLEDVVGSISMLIAGGVLVMSFRKSMFK